MNNLKYDDVIKAKEEVGKIDWTDITTIELVSFVSGLSLAEKAVIACGDFVEDLRWGLSFQMPSTESVMNYNIDRLEANGITDCVEYDLFVSELQATDEGFYTEEVKRHVYTGRYK